MRQWFGLGLGLLLMASQVSCEEDSHLETKVLCVSGLCQGNVAYSCENGLSVAKVCPFGCALGQCLPMCTEGMKQCSSVGVPQICLQGTWVDQTACVNGNVCENGACVPALGNDDCVNDSIRCAAGIPQKCIQQVWVNQPACGMDQVCRQGICISNQTCVMGQTQCSGGIPQTCVNGVWISRAGCGDGYTCVSGKCQPVAGCQEGSPKCGTNDRPYECIGGQWVEQAACPEHSKCTSGQCIPLENELCWDISCSQEEVCINSVCVPQKQLTMHHGDACDTETWVDYCTDADEAVTCVSNKVYIAVCPTGCRVIDFSMLMDGQKWFPAFCDTKWTSRCQYISNEIPYCVAEHTASGIQYYESTYQCVPVFGGGYIGFDYGLYQFSKPCSFGCDVAGEHCAPEK